MRKLIAVLAVVAIALPVCADLVVTFSITGAEDAGANPVTWSGYFSVDDGKRLVLDGAEGAFAPINTIQTVYSTHNAQPLGFTPGFLFWVYVVGENRVQVGWLGEPNDTLAFTFATIDGPTPATTWNDMVGQTFPLESAYAQTGQGLDHKEFFSSGGQVSFQAVPEPGTLGVLALGAAGVASMRRRRQAVTAE